jgi:intracellular sulfur oxidation DsrE/DsrF family protein
MKQAPQLPPSRKNFLLFAIAAFFSAAGLRSITKNKPKKPATVKMLTQEGLLVEIDENIIAMRGKQISDTELQQWVKTHSKK